ncbi:MAG: 2-hydroxyacid dehydrogenase [Candidatus Hodarchaeales archaeon]|jgi:phosphoglycerate dehydrogenase-like enzyme
MKIALLLNLAENYLEDLRKKLSEHEIVMSLPSYSEETIEAVQNAHVIIGERVDRNVLEKASNLKLLQVPWVGINRIDFEFLKNNNITVCNSKWNDLIVAEYAVGLILAAAKKLVSGDREFRQGSWVARQWGSKQLNKSKILLVGYGSISKQIARLLQPFNVKIVALRKKNINNMGEESKIKIINWDDYALEAGTSDFVVVTLPLTNITKGIINEDKLMQIKKGAFLINVGRGDVIEEKALFEVLKSGHLEGGAIDAWYQYKSQKNRTEPFYPSKFPFHELKNVIMSPHRAASFMDSKETVWDDTISNIKALEEKKALKNVVSLEDQY